MATPAEIEFAPVYSQDAINRETDARFAAQTGMAVGRKLDPNNPTDKAMIPIWIDIQKKVQAEADAGTLVTTYDHPVVAQGLADAQVANTVAAAHLDAAAVAPDPATVQDHLAAATLAAQVSAQRLKEAAAIQPPSVSPTLELLAVKDVAAAPPLPANAPAADQIARAQMSRPSAPKAAIPPKEVLAHEASQRFWRETNFKVGQALDPNNPADQAMAPKWLDIYKQVLSEANQGTLTLTPAQSSIPITQPSQITQTPAPSPSPILTAPQFASSSPRAARTGPGPGRQDRTQPPVRRQTSPVTPWTPSFGQGQPQMPVPQMPQQPFGQQPFGQQPFGQQPFGQPPRQPGPQFGRGQFGAPPPQMPFGYGAPPPQQFAPPPQQQFAPQPAQQQQPQQFAQTPQMPDTSAPADTSSQPAVDPSMQMTPSDSTPPATTGGLTIGKVALIGLGLAGVAGLTYALTRRSSSSYAPPYRAPARRY